MPPLKQIASSEQPEDTLAWARAHGAALPTRMQPLRFRSSAQRHGCPSWSWLCLPLAWAKLTPLTPALVGCLEPPLATQELTAAGWCDAICSTQNKPVKAPKAPALGQAGRLGGRCRRRGNEGMHQPFPIPAGAADADGCQHLARRAVCRALIGDGCTPDL